MGERSGTHFSAEDAARDAPRPGGSAPSAAQSRLALLDGIRGAAIVSMVLFHLVYDLVYIYGVELGWYRGFGGTAWQVSIGWTFVCVAGCSAALSRNNGKRACKLGLVAIAITVATTVVPVDIPIRFGVIHCLALCTAVVCLACPWLDRLPPLPFALACLGAAYLTCTVSDGGIQLVPGDVAVPLPTALYRFNELAFIGLPGPGYSSGDYFPLLPYLFVYLAGYFALGWARQAGSGRGMRILAVNPVPALAWLGRHSLPIYLVHQFVLLGILLLVFGHM